TTFWGFKMLKSKDKGLKQTSISAALQQSSGAGGLQAKDPIETVVAVLVKSFPDSNNSTQTILDHITSASGKIEKAIAQLDDKIAKVEKRTDNLEETTTKMDTRIKENKACIDQCLQNTGNLIKENKWIRRLIENQARVQNVRIVGLETVEEDLVAFLSKWAPSILNMDLEDSHFRIQWAYKIPTAKSSPNENRPTVIFKVNSEDTRNKILAAARRRKLIQYCGNKVMFFPDLCPETQKKRQAMLLIKQKCMDFGFKSSLLYPTKLQVERNDVVYVF
uniref:L1 transposable element RRM domain-containing protein n=1 Tax=Latimeria chalumnae TaxID=7897 RepID=H3AXB6_LATCH